MPQNKLDSALMEYFKNAESKHPSVAKVSSEYLGRFCESFYSESPFCDEGDKKLEPFDEVVSLPVKKG